LGSVALWQLLVAALALAARLESSRHVRVVEREVIKVVAVPTATKHPPGADAVVVSTPPPAADPAPVAAPALPPPTSLTTPQVADPRAEQLLKEARQARVAGDMGLAILKLEEARSRAPEDPNIQYELGMTHEVMGVFDTAAAAYERVFQMGTAGSGALYEMAAAKLRDGFQADLPLGKLALGRVRIFNDPDHEGGQRVILTIPIQKAPGVEIEVKEMSVAVEFFNHSTRDRIIPLEDKSWVTQQWVSGAFDWAGDEETLRMTYVIPKQSQTTQHLFGEQTYYGQVVSLLYKGEVFDVQAWPRDLAARSQQKTAAPETPQAPEFLDKDTLPPNFDPNQPMVLPPR
jgi:hypothetical protein